uniref:Beta-glucosidase n=1 Tax=Timema douglasi TaxID=61478 RepID=A0A7R8VDP5_TIMDO|nr:unnamed protein product [Timema douglasi]
MARIAAAVFLVTVVHGVLASNYSFPEDFLLGSATAAYQMEVAWNESGKGENIWDHLTHTHLEWIIEGENSDVADDSYHKYKEGVQAFVNISAGIDYYNNVINELLDNDIQPLAGIDYYNNVINELWSNDIQPLVTMYHWDLPQHLQDLGGWVNPILVEYYEDYARVLFTEFGDRFTEEVYTISTVSRLSWLCLLEELESFNTEIAAVELNTTSALANYATEAGSPL